MIQINKTLFHRLNVKIFYLFETIIWKKLFTWIAALQIE